MNRPYRRYYSPQMRALGVLEILELILSFADQATARECSLVCRFWQEPALNAYWARLDDETDFKKLLLPILLPKGKCRCWSPRSRCIVRTNTLSALTS